MHTPLPILSKEDTDYYIPLLHTLELEQWKLVMLSACFYDKKFFAEEVCKRWTTDQKSGMRYESPPFHVELWQLSSMGIDFECVVPRSFGKTTAIKIDVTHSMLFQTERSTLYIASLGLGESFVGDIRYEIETNPIMLLLFGNLIPSGSQIGQSGKKWRQKHLQLSTGVELETITKRQPVRGKRPTRVVVDDPEEESDVSNYAKAEAFFKWFWTSLYNTLNPTESSVIILGTIISDNCFVNRVKVEAEARGITIVEYQAIKDFETKGFNGELLWPERWTREMLIERDRKITRPYFLQEYQNKPLPFRGRPVFKNLQNLKIVESIGYLDEFKMFKNIFDEAYKDNALHIGMDFSNGNAAGAQSGDAQSIDVRNGVLDLVAQLTTWVDQRELVKIFDKFIRFIILNFPNIRIGINPEMNSGDVFMDRAQMYDWYNLMRFTETTTGITKTIKKTYGFWTGEKSKDLLIAAIQDYIDRGGEVTKEQYIELEHFVHHDDGSTGATQGQHDDRVISLGASLLSGQRGTPSNVDNLFGD